MYTGAQRAVQNSPRKLADAFIIGRGFVGADRVALMLGKTHLRPGAAQLLRRAADAKPGQRYPMSSPTQRATASLSSTLAAALSPLTKSRRSQNPIKP